MLALNSLWLNVANFIAALLYLFGTALIWHCARSQQDSSRATILLIAFAGFAIHSIELYNRIFLGLDTNLSLAHSISLVAWMAVLLFFLAALFRPIINLGIAVLPTAMFAVLIGGHLSTTANNVQNQGASADLHLLLAVIAFGVLSLAFAQACLITLQEYQLRRPIAHRRQNSAPSEAATNKTSSFTSGNRFSFPSLPPLQTMETLLFQLLILGFMLLTANLVTGLASTSQEYGQLFQWNHHTLLTLIAWLGFGLLIMGHFVFGWRGQQAARYTMIGFAVFILGYFGPRIVRELILL